MNIGLLVNIDNLSNNLRKKIDYGRYKNKVGELYPGQEIKIVRSIAYGSFHNRQAVNFKTALRKYLGYELKSIDEPFDWNTTMVIDAVTMIQNIDSLVIGSSDPLLSPLITYFQNHGKSVTLLASNIPPELRKVATYYLEIDQGVLESGPKTK